MLGQYQSIYNKVWHEAEVIPGCFVIFDLICGPLEKKQNMLEPAKCPDREIKMSLGLRTK